MNKSIPLLISCLSFILFSLNYISAQVFVENQMEAGIDHYVKHGAFLGGGAAFFDYDNDGDEDLYITSGEDRDHFYVNMGDGTFENKAIEAGLVVTQIYYTTGVIAGDIDNDGYKDLFVTTWYSDFDSHARNLLFKNNGDGTFTDIWNHNEDGDKTQSMGATFIDFDLDGLLDIYVVNYVESSEFIYGPNGAIIGYAHECYNNRFYHNEGNGTFKERANTLAFNDLGCSLAATATDFDSDGDMDIYLANDFGEFIEPNKLYVNNIIGNPFFEMSSAYNVDIPMYGMGIAVGDADNDLDLDLYVTNFGQNILLRNDGNIFEEIGNAANVSDTWIIEDSTMAIGWGTAFLDFDNDADLDLYVANGYVPSPSFLPSNLYMNDKLFTNMGNMDFADESETLGIGNQFSSRGMTYGDYDNDGDLDIVSVVLNVPMNVGGWQTILYKNESNNSNNWLQVSLEGITVNRDAYGSHLYLYAGNKKILHEVSGGGSHASHFSSRAHFGLGDSEYVDSLKIIWTGGEKTQTLYDIEANQHIYVTEDTATVEPPVPVFENKNIGNDFSIFPNPIQGDWVQMNFERPLDQNVFLKIYNPLGQFKENIFLEKGKRSFQIDMERMEKGVYLFTVISEEYIRSKKVVN